MDQNPFGASLPQRVGDLELGACDLGPMYSIAPFKGQKDKVHEALTSVGLGFPAPGEVVAHGDAQVIWTGRDQAFLIGIAPDDALGDMAAITDQGDAWCAARLRGPGAEDVLARLVPLDLRAGAFPAGRTLRSQLGHMTVSITREADGFVILAFRSMARDLAHELGQVMRLVAARGLAR
jgi:sarcosine oxidase subunit gamma